MDCLFFWTNKQGNIQKNMSCKRILSWRQQTEKVVAELQTTHGSRAAWQNY